MLTIVLLGPADHPADAGPAGAAGRDRGPALPGAGERGVAVAQAGGQVPAGQFINIQGYLIMVFIVIIKFSGWGLKLKAGTRVPPGRFSMANLD